MHFSASAQLTRFEAQNKPKWLTLQKCIGCDVDKKIGLLLLISLFLKTFYVEKCEAFLKMHELSMLCGLLLATQQRWRKWSLKPSFQPSCCDLHRQCVSEGAITFSFCR